MSKYKGSDVSITDLNVVPDQDGNVNVKYADLQNLCERYEAHIKELKDVLRAQVDSVSIIER